MIEKVRSIAIVYVLAKRWLESCGAYIGATSRRQATV